MPPSRPSGSRAHSYDVGYWPQENFKPVNSRAVSCDNCRRRKMKCSRTFPCSSCDMRGEDCSWPQGAHPPPAGGDSELEAAWIEVRRLRRLTDMLMSRLAELQHIGGGGDSESDYGYPSSERDFTEREYRPSSHLPHSHLQRSSTYPPPAPSSSSDGSVMSYEGSSSYPTSQRTTGYSHNSHYDYRSQDDGSALFPGFPGGLPFAPPGVGGGPSPPTTTVSSHVAPTAAQQTASQPGDIFVSDGTDYMMQQQRFY